MDHKRFLIITLIINLLFFVVGYYLLTQIDIRYIRDWIADFGVFAPLVYILVYILLFIMPFNPIPKSFLTYFALLSFGPFFALILSLFSDVISITINYSLFRNFHHFLPNKRRDSITKFVSKNGWKALFIARMFPVTNGYSGADFPSYAAGVVRMSYPIFIAATMIPWIVIDVVYFYGAEALLHSPYVLPAFVLFALLSVGYGVYRIKQDN